MKPPVWLILLHAAAHASMASKEQLFLLVTEPRSGSDWLVDLLDAHPNVCVPAGRWAENVHFLREDVSRKRDGLDRECRRGAGSAERDALGLLAVARARVRAVFGPTGASCVGCMGEIPCA